MSPLRRLFFVCLTFVFQRAQCGLHPAERERHARVPRRVAAHLRSVIGNDDAVESIAMQNAPPALRARAARVTGSAENDGFAKAVEMHILGACIGESSQRSSFTGV